MTPAIANTDVLEYLASLCQEAETGTFFITTTDNKACHILIEGGRITALSYGRLRGQKVAAELPFIQIERFSFKPRIKMPLPGRAFVDDEVNILQALGLHHGPDHIPEHSKRVYRGVELEQESVVPPVQKAGNSKENGKPPRMYRGQLLED